MSETTILACRVELLELPGTFSIGRISEIVLSFQKLTDNAVHDDHVICTDFLADDSGRITGNLELDPKRLIGRQSTRLLVALFDLPIS